MNQLSIHPVYTLYQTANNFYIQPCDQPEEALIIERQGGSLSKTDKFSTISLPYDVVSCLVQGIIGIKQLINGAYLIVITSSSLVGYISGHRIYKVDKTQIIPIYSVNENSNERDRYWEETYIKMLESVLNTPSFYFSHTYDLTNSMQRNYDLEGKQGNASRTYDERFLWNTNLMADIDGLGPCAAKFRIPLILGFVSIQTNAIGHGINWALISRRSVKRAGVRFNTRGADCDGNTANFVETEQIVERDGDFRTSFVQIRGSIPLIWSQTPGYSYMPTIKVHNADHSTAMRKHFDELNNYYGDVSLVCLINQRGNEGKLAHELSQKMQEYSYIPYHYFDFHKECGNMRWHRLSILIDRLEETMRANRFFSVQGKDVVSRQVGVIRSNCIDSLDRTNVVQSMIAKHMLIMQLDLFGPNTVQISLSSFMNTFKNVWADNADALSIQYTGTPALKTDFTRTGRRTKMGMMNDGINSVTRYFTNNFMDSYRQDAIDLFLGNYGGYPSPLYRPLAQLVTPQMQLTLVVLTLLALYFFTRWQ